MPMRPICRRPSTRRISPSTAPTLSGTPQQEPRWKRAVNFTVGSARRRRQQALRRQIFPAGDQGGRRPAGPQYHRRDGPADRHARLDERRRPRRRRMPSSPPSRRRSAIRRQWRDMSGLVDRPRRPARQCDAVDAVRDDYQIGKLGEPIRRWEWGMTPMTINAYANPTMVEIVFPAAILQPPFFDPNADAAVNYGGIGAVIGHEMSHHFDDQGAKYDLHGKLVDWWTPADAQELQGAARQARGRIRRLRAAAGHARQRQADDGRECRRPRRPDRRARRLSSRRSAAKAPPVIDGFTADQRFYLGWAQVWRRNYREADLRQRLLTDPHSPVRAARRHRPQHGPVVSGVRRPARAEALPRTRQSACASGSLLRLIACAGPCCTRSCRRSNPRPLDGWGAGLRRR